MTFGVFVCVCDGPAKRSRIDRNYNNTYIIYIQLWYSLTVVVRREVLRNSELSKAKLERPPIR